MSRALLVLVVLLLTLPGRAGAAGWDPATVPVPPAKRADTTQTIVTTNGEAVSTWFDGESVLVAAVPGGPVAQPLDARTRPELVAAPGGATLAAWGQRDRVLVARRAPGDAGGFGAPVDVGATTQSLGPELAVAPDGTAVVAWGNGTDVVFATEGPGGWSAPETVATGYGLTLALAAADGGRAALAYEGPGNQTWLSTRRSDGTWSPAYAIGESRNDVVNVSVGIDAAGRAVATWGSDDVPGYGDKLLRAAMSDADGTWSPVTGIGAAGSAPGLRSAPILRSTPALAVSARGDVLIAWPDVEGSLTPGSGLQVATGTTAGPALATTGMDGGYPAGVNALASMAPDGSAVVALSTGPFVSFVRQGTGPFVPSVITCDGVKGIPAVLGLAANADGTATVVTAGTESQALLRHRTLAAAEQPAPCPARTRAPAPAPSTGSLGTGVAKPAAVAAFAKQRLRGVLARGLKVAVRYDPGGRVRLQLVLERSTARKLRLGRRARVVGTRTVAVALGKTPTVRLRVTKARAVRRALRRARAVPVVVRVRVAGRTVAQQRLTLRR